MGIKGFKQVLGDHAPKAIRRITMKSLVGRKVAIDASTSLYQFLVAVRSQGQNLTTSEGDVTSHLIGLFYRTINMLENGLKPVYVFDGKPPTMKSGELAKRRERREKAESDLKKAEEEGDAEEIVKHTKRLAKVTPEINDEARRLLKLMGVPYVTAPCEAEAECAALARQGKVWAAASQDMDTLLFGAPVLIRNLTVPTNTSAANGRRLVEIEEIHLEDVLQGLGDFSIDQLIDMGILLGCDYCDSIRGVGPKSAYTHISDLKSIEEIVKLEKIAKAVPEHWPFEQARELFRSPEVSDCDQTFVWEKPDVEGLVQFLVKEKEFSEDRVRSGAAKLMKNVGKPAQGRLDAFFKTSKPQPKPAAATGKRNQQVAKGGAVKKAKK
ncbi:Elongation of fatty acids protein 2 [Linderina pennispora]|nr:Elongation of fatty acids protein 2 [Linderina pennispora]